MSRLSELMAEFCPNGVDYKPLEEIATSFARGSGIKRDEVTAKGVPCVRYGEIYTTYNIGFDTCISHTTSEVANRARCFEHGDILFAITGEKIEDIAKCTAYLGHEKCYAGGDVVMMKHEQNPKYLVYALSTEAAQKQKSKGKVKSKVVHSSVPALKSIVIPIPPLAVQEEIVRLLDAYTNEVETLTAELEAELAARRKQYEQYRDKLLTFGDDVERKSLGSVAEIFRGGSLQKRDFVSSGIPCIHYGQIYTSFGVWTDKPLSYMASEKATNQKFAKSGDIIMAVTSETVEDVCKCVAWMGDSPIAISGHTAIIQHNQNPKYLSYYFHTSQFATLKRPLAHGVKVIEVTPEKLKSIVIPLPPLAEQKRIVEILDKFDALCNDETAGLTAEIAARKKQYEYCRDKLLTFKKAS